MYPRVQRGNSSQKLGVVCRGHFENLTFSGIGPDVTPQRRIQRINTLSSFFSLASPAGALHWLNPNSGQIAREWMEAGEVSLLRCPTVCWATVI